MKSNKITPLAELKPEDFAVENGEAHRVAKSLGEMKVTQLRKFFTQFKAIEKKLKEKSGPLEAPLKAELLLLNVDLAYAFGRNLITKEFYDRIKTYLSEISTPEDVRKLVQFLEAVIAYHKYEKREYEEREKK
jgi:CRISPR-associated protein Csm2